jgi:phosphotransferase system  glucose/maltose/N-acetylglucosamine-specific IIC component
MIQFYYSCLAIIPNLLLFFTAIYLLIFYYFFKKMDLKRKDEKLG